MFVSFRNINVGRTRKLSLVDNWTHQVGRGGLGTN